VLTQTCLVRNLSAVRAHCSPGPLVIAIPGRSEEGQGSGCPIRSDRVWRWDRGYESIDQAIEISNDTRDRLAAYVNGADTAQARVVASRLQAGQVSINGASDPAAPFGGYKMSGNGREGGDFAFYEFLKTKAVMG
jgi:hypothetical protein